MSIDGVRLTIQSEEKRTRQSGSVYIVSVPLEELTGKVEVALDVGRGDLRRHGCLLESTRYDIENWIKVLAIYRHIDKARHYLSVYGELLEEEKLTLNGL